jgi:aerobic carbon-monoxide dehydrogenase small subunit
MMNDHAAQRTMKTIRFELNGEPVTAQVEPHHNVVELLQTMGLHGARESCGQGLCGCCTVLVDGVAVSGCLYFAAQLDGARVDTIERTEREGELDVVQQAFAECGAFQCGFCTPGFVLMTRQLLDHNPAPSEDEIRHYLSGNLCRCATYPEIIRAVQLAARTRKAGA